MNNREQLNEWVDGNEEYIKAVALILTQGMIDSDAVSLKQHLTLILGHRATLVTSSALIHRLLTLARYEYLPTKTKDLTETDRKVALERSCADHEYWCDTIDGIISTIDKQISSAQSILSFEKTALNQLGEH